MRRVTLLNILLFALGLTATAQVTITESNFPRLASLADSARAVTNPGLAYPTGGENQSWDYGSLPAGQLSITTYVDATDDPDFPDALNYIDSPIELTVGPFSFELPSKLYEAVDADGWYRTGRSFEAITVPLTTITGGPDDRLDYLTYKFDYEGRADLIQFPMTYGDQWEGVYSFDIRFNLTLAAFGLNQAPAFNRNILTIEREAIGYGELIIPTADGTPSAPIDVVLVRVDETKTDSIYLNGSPAPQALLDAFGVPQGLTSQDSYYVFYSPGFGGPVALFEDLAGGTVGRALYWPRATDVGTATRQAQAPIVQGFPNPVQAGTYMTIAMDQPLTAGEVRFYNLQGQQVHVSQYRDASDRFLQVEIPADLPSGLLMYQVTDDQHLPIGIGKVQVF